ncbi:MAG: response regulator [Candidatus Sumerlaeota bacterium]
MKLRLLLVDDEPLARERALRLLKDANDIDIIGECANGNDAFAAIEMLQPDVVLLDINMPGIDGLRLVEALDDPPAIIFATAHDHHAVQAFELDAVDYLLKPFSGERLKRALDRVRRQFALDHPALSPIESKIPAENGRAIEFLTPSQIVAARIEEGVVFLFRDDGEKLIFAGTLQDLEQQLPPGQFIRASRQSLVQSATIRSIEPMEGGALRLGLTGGVQEIATRRRARFFRKLN